MQKLLLSMSILCSFIISTTVFANAKEGFPGRAEFPEIPIYKKAQLMADYDNVVIVDARSSLEFETLRVKGALNIPVASKKFGEMVKALRKKSKKRIVFYCNGRTCYKSYKATKAAIKNGLKDVYAFDAGIFEWAKAYPKFAVLLGSSPMDPKNIIPKEELKARFLSPKKFTETARAAPRSKILVMDVRDMYQRAGIGFFTGMERWVSLDDEKKLNKYLDKALKEKRTLYIYDEAGKQVRWLQYALERKNIKDYYFMKKGAKGFYKEMIY